MCGVQSCGQLSQELKDQVGSEPARPVEPRTQGLSVQELHAQEVHRFAARARPRVQILDSAHVGMAHPPSELHLAPETQQGVGIEGPLAEDGLQRHLLPEDLVPRPVDLPHSSAGDKGHDREATRQQLARAEPWRPVVQPGPRRQGNGGSIGGVEGFRTCVERSR